MIAALCVILAIIASLAIAGCVLVMDRAKDDRETAEALRRDTIRMRDALKEQRALARHLDTGWLQANQHVRSLRRELDALTTCVVCRKRIEPSKRPCCEDCVDVDQRRTG